MHYICVCVCVSNLHVAVKWKVKKYYMALFRPWHAYIWISINIISIME